MDPRGTVGSIYKGEYHTLVHTTYENSGSYGFREEDFLCFTIISLRELAIDPPPPSRGGAISDPRGMFGRIYVKLHITMLHTKYRSFGCCGFSEEDFFHVLSIVSLWGRGAVWTPGPPLAGFIKKTLLRTKYESSGPCGFGEEYFIYVFPIVCLGELMTPGRGHF